MTINEVMGCFDFEKVHKVMKFLNWKWYDREVPEVFDLVEVASKLLEDLKTSSKETTYMSTGGFTAFRYIDDENKPAIGLRFSIENIDY